MSSSSGNGGGGRRRTSQDDDENEGEWGNDSDWGLGFRSSLFSNIDRWTNRMFRTFEDLENRAKSGKIPPNALYYGYSITIGPDGKPHVREFGNIKPSKSAGRQVLEAGPREPFVETLMDDKTDELKLVVEMPGVQKEDIQTEVTENTMKITAARGDRRYDTTVDLETEVDPNSAKATYNNGVLEVRLKPKRREQGSRGVRIKVE
jgi:HSP20 family protein